MVSYVSGQGKGKEAGEKRLPTPRGICSICVVLSIKSILKNISNKGNTETN